MARKPAQQAVPPRGEPDWSILAWSARDASHDELEARFAELQLLALGQRDAVVGLAGELSVARERLDELETTDIGRAFKRIDKLEEQREVLLHRLRLGRFGEDEGDEVQALKSSATWRAGRIIVAPVSLVKRLARR